MKESDIYKQVAIQTSSPAALVVMLYEGAIRNLRDTADAVRQKDIERKRQSVDRAVAILQHLQSTLDRERGAAVAADLANLYNYVISGLCWVLPDSTLNHSKRQRNCLRSFCLVGSSWRRRSLYRRTSPFS